VVKFICQATKKRQQFKKFKPNPLKEKVASDSELLPRSKKEEENTEINVAAVRLSSAKCAKILATLTQTPSGKRVLINTTQQTPPTCPTSGVGWWKSTWSGIRINLYY